MDAAQPIKTVRSRELGVRSKEDGFDFEKLAVYQKALDFIDYAYRAAENFPPEERFGLSSQFQRAAQSIALNIGEGSGGSRAEFIQFLRIARRSVRECVVILTIAARRNYLDEKKSGELQGRCLELSRMLSGLMRSLT